MRWPAVLASALAVVAAVGPAVVARAQGPNSTVKKLNPFTGNPEAIKEGRTLWVQYGCSGCHGVMGGGGMAPPVIDDQWKFGSSDEVLFKLIKGEISEQTMPKAFAGLQPDQIWKMIAYVRSIYSGDPARADW